MKTKERPLGFIDVVCVGVNGVIGSGIFFFPGKLAELLGPASILSFLLIGLLLVFVSLCFYEAGSYFNQSGGSYIYAEKAFGPVIGFGVGWVSWVNQLFAWTAVASAVSSYASYFSESLKEPMPTRYIAVAILAIMGCLNIYGVKLGARVSNTFTVAKLVPLLIILVVGLPMLSFANFEPFAPHGVSAFGAASLMTFFAFQGFENIPAPAGEISRPERNVPLAVITSLVVTLIIYTLIQTVAVGVNPNLAGSGRPLADVAEILLGTPGGVLVALGALISMIGYTSAAALTTPRYLVALATDHHIPPGLANRHVQLGTPYVAILATTLIGITLALTLNFQKLVDITNVAVSLQYSFTCLSVLWLRKQRGIKKSPVIPILGVAVSLWLGYQAAFTEMIWCFAFLAAGFLLKGIYHVCTRNKATPQT